MKIEITLWYPYKWVSTDNSVFSTYTTPEINVCPQTSTISCLCTTSWCRPIHKSRSQLRKRNQLPMSGLNQKGWTNTRGYTNMAKHKTWILSHNIVVGTRLFTWTQLGLQMIRKCQQRTILDLSIKPCCALYQKQKYKFSTRYNIKNWLEFISSHLPFPNVWRKALLFPTFEERHCRWEQNPITQCQWCIWLSCGRYLSQDGNLHKA